MNHINCLTYAFGRWLREGGALIIERSRHLKYVPHFSFAKSVENVERWHYVPIKPTTHYWQFWRAFWFKGRVVKTNGEDSAR